jgi:hypothetical protein
MTEVECSPVSLHYPVQVMGVEQSFDLLKLLVQVSDAEPFPLAL